MIGREQARTARGRAEAELFEAAPQAVALLDAAGRVLSLNAAARAGAETPPRRAGDLLAPGAEPELYRLLRDVEDGRTGEAALRGVGGDALQISVWPAGRGVVALSWRPKADAARPAAAAVASAGANRLDGLFDAAGAAWLHVGADGRVRASGATLSRWLGEPAEGKEFNEIFPDAARRLANRGGRADRALGRTPLAGGEAAPRAVSLIYAPGPNAGEAVLLAAPAPASESANIAPLGAADSCSAPSTR